jgi:hypothetical protein
VQPVRRDGVAADLVEHVDDIGVGDVADPASAPSIHERDPTTAVPILAAVANDDQRGHCFGSTVASVSTVSPSNWALHSQERLLRNWWSVM